MSVINIFFLVAVFLGSGVSVHAESKEGRDGFAKHLYRMGRFREASLEYERLLYDRPDDGIRLSLAESYRKSGDSPGALRILDEIIENSVRPECRKEAFYLSGRIHYEEEKYGMALAEVSSGLRGGSGDYIGGKLAYLGALCYARQDRWDDAAELLRNEGIDKWGGRFGEGKKIKRKSPKMAGFLSAVLPGAGHIYAGQFYDGIVAFLLNASFIAWAASSFERDREATGAVVTFVELGWYTGGIYTAAYSARKYNAYQRRLFFDRLNESGYPEKASLDGEFHIRMFSCKFQ